MTLKHKRACRGLLAIKMLKSEALTGEAYSRFIRGKSSSRLKQSYGEAASSKEMLDWGFIKV